jgi:hypothetical protein
MAAVPTAAIAAVTAVAARARPHRVTAAVDVRPRVTVEAEADVQLQAAAEAIRRRAAEVRTAVDRRTVAADMEDNSTGGNDMGGNTALGYPSVVQHSNTLPQQ